MNLSANATSNKEPAKGPAVEAEEDFLALIDRHHKTIAFALLALIFIGLGMLGWRRLKLRPNELASLKQEVATLRAENEALKQGLMERGQVLSGAGERPKGSKEVAGRININTASKAELESLPGIGPKLAERIMAYRESRGRFKTIEEIKNVAGIGEKTFAKIKDLIRVK